MEIIKDFKPVCVSFDHPYNIGCDIKCYTKISVQEFRYNNDDTIYYKISYKHRFVNQNGEKIEKSNSSPVAVIHPHPFADNIDTTLAELSEGNLIVKNPLTEKMIEFLLMKDSKLSEFVGNSCPKAYRRTIIHDIARKWD